MSSRRDCLSQVHTGQEKHANAGLWLDKYINEQAREDTESRRKFVGQVSTLPIPEAYETFYHRWKKMLTDCGALTRRARVKGRMVVGLGTESVLETSVTLHRTYGVPYIPGSALKGLAASYARQKLSDEWYKDGEAYKVVFGDTEDAGYITFFDALYIPGTGHKGQMLYPDVITVHHPEYYQGATGIQAPADWNSPTPIPFLSATGTYLIALAAPELQNAGEWNNATFDILEGALKMLGIGAKTSSGYGRMELELPPAKTVDPEVRKAEGYKHELDALKDVAGQIHGYYQKWQQFRSEEARMLLAQAIVEKVRKAGREKQTAEKSWYKELQAFLDAHQP